MLHLDLGIGNKIKDLLRELLEKIGSKDPVAALRANELRDEIDCLAAVIDDSAGDLQNILDEHAAGDREDLGTSARAKTDEVLRQIESGEAPVFEGGAADGPWRLMFKLALTAWADWNGKPLTCVFMAPIVLWRRDQNAKLKQMRHQL